MALPFVDSVVGREVLQKKCTRDGSIVVNAAIQDVEGLGVEYGVFPDSPTYYGYRYVEGGYAYKDVPSMMERAEFDPVSGQTQVKKHVTPRAAYVLFEESRQDSLYFYRTRISIKERSTGRELAAFDWFAFRGGWAERVMTAFSDAGPGAAASCGSWQEKRDKTMAMLHSALRPALPIASSGQPAAAADVKP